MSDVIEFDKPADLMTRSRVAAYWELIKPRIAGMVLVVTALGFFLALEAKPNVAHFAVLTHLVLGMAMVAGGANALNQYLEVEHDRRMVRTADRPLPSGRLTTNEVLSFALLLSLGGIAYLALQTNLLAALLSGIAWLSYGFVYTPLKRVTASCVQIGAIPGALPPVIGWVACTGSLSVGAVMLFAILFFWQLPHFAAIAWLYREDYDRAGFPMLSVADPDGSRTSVHMIGHSLALLLVGLLPVAHGLAGVVYGVGAALLGLGFLGFGLWFAFQRTKQVARLSVLASVIYLPSLFTLMLIDRIYPV